MKTYDLIAIGTGSSMNIVEALLQRHPEKRVAVIDKDDPGGICLTRGCIPTKLLLYPAELRRVVEEAGALGIHTEVRKVDFPAIMDRMRSLVARDSGEIAKGLSEAKNIDYFRGNGAFVAPHRIQVGDETLTSGMIFLCLGSRPAVPAIQNLEQVDFHTSDTILNLRSLPASLAILGGGYIAAEFGHFFAAMGSKVTVIGRNPMFLPAEEPEISELARKAMSRHMTILTNHEVIRVDRSGKGKKTVTARERAGGKLHRVLADEILVAVGRASNADILHPEQGGIRVDEKGWISVNEYLETSQPNVWCFGDATGKHLFKHVANYESRVVYYNAVLGQKIRADYHAVPHAVFTYPEIASVGLGQKQAIQSYGDDRVLVGFQRFQNTAKGEAMALREYFVKVVVDGETDAILGAHVIGPQASLLIQEIITQMYTDNRSMKPIVSGMHIHPALSEAVERAFIALMPVAQYDHMLRQGWI